MIITNAEIVGRLKLLAEEHLKADSGTTTTAVNSSISDGIDYTNKIICFITGDNAYADRVVTSCDTATGTLTFNALDNAVDNVDEFCIISVGYQSDVSQAHNIITNDFKNRGYDIDLFLNHQTQLKEMYIYKTIELICAGLMNDGVDTDAYFVNYERYKELYRLESSNVIADYDINESGTITDDEEDTTVGKVRFSR